MPCYPLRAHREHATVWYIAADHACGLCAVPGPPLHGRHAPSAAARARRPPSSPLRGRDVEAPACRGKRQQAVETLVTTAQMDPWLPELELRPPAVAHAHRLSVEQAKVGLVWYYNSCHDALRANKYRDDAVFWRIRRLNQVLFPAARPQCSPASSLRAALAWIAAMGAHTHGCPPGPCL